MIGRHSLHRMSLLPDMIHTRSHFLSIYLLQYIFSNHILSVVSFNARKLLILIQLINYAVPFMTNYFYFLFKRCLPTLRSEVLDFLLKALLFYFKHLDLQFIWNYELVCLCVHTNVCMLVCSWKGQAFFHGTAFAIFTNHVTIYVYIFLNSSLCWTLQLVYPCANITCFPGGTGPHPQLWKE